MEIFGCCGGRKWDERKANADTEKAQAETQTTNSLGHGWWESITGQNSSASDQQRAGQLPDYQDDPNDLEAVKADHMSQQLVGVGIVFDAGENGRGPNDEGLRVSGLTPKGSAEASHKIRMHDKLAMVDGQDVRAWSAKDISPVILGLPGTSVMLGFFSEKTGEYYTVTLYRKQLHQVI
mmetsp:Transcript_34066/g.80359  ORF Transcript_34066/g.80359 Transcript_34066/m.80359 type:complete len:179 (+) Transcript_34066:176-712(+)